jgi:hypothetical protein
MSVAAGITLLVALPVLAAAISVVLLVVFSYLTGWRALASAYPLGGGFVGPHFPGGGIVVGPSGWTAPPLWVGVDEAGIVLHPVMPFRLAFASLRLPWTAISKVERKPYMLFETLQLEYDGGAKATIGFLPSAAATAISERVAGRCA